MRRAGQVGWVLDYWLDLTADFRRFYRLSPAEALALPGPEYMALAVRVVAYQGVMYVRAQAEEQDNNRNVPTGAAMVAVETLTDLFE